uniref:Carbonic anhydrase n=1 Tax=Tetraselmis sp. GSL018 TaxID=582737 RepID=A0A061RA07_9CHLO|eukprot:CAMPEP_0177596060 /NCGR_PEP_ID=MMETSP0419_2-20121207/10778_1 /TAXON_ID=582737 /ORGANISM="Tetraselmis sp., Strain GSL018" /LENGTH=316 /DNA_ID=CAMNT_0019087741 /DNA_START=134 /DNA_END=1084 /DNA_ORIENTATION=+
MFKFICVIWMAGIAFAAEYDYFSLAEDWKQLDGTWCASTEQTPIDLETDTEIVRYKQMPMEFAPTFSMPVVTGATGNNNGHNVNLEFQGSPGVIFRFPKGRSFTSLNGPYTGTGPLNPGRKMLSSGFEPALLQGTLIDVHWHVPSEHAVRGRLYPAEAHFVHAISHKDDPDCTYMAGDQGPFCLGVVGVLYEVHHDDTETELDEGFTKVMEGFKNFPSDGQADTQPLPEPLDLASLLPESKEFWHYRGSLTTPGCNENVTWFVLQEPKAIGWSHFNSLRNSILHDDLGDLNARPPLPLNSRIVFKSNYDEDIHQVV